MTVWQTGGDLSAIAGQSFARPWLIDAKSICDRQAEIEGRAIPGHWPTGECRPSPVGKQEGYRAQRYTLRGCGFRHGITTRGFN